MFVQISMISNGWFLGRHNYLKITIYLKFWVFLSYSYSANKNSTIFYSQIAASTRRCDPHRLPFVDCWCISNQTCMGTQIGSWSRLPRCTLLSLFLRILWSAQMALLKISKREKKNSLDFCLNDNFSQKYSF